MVPITASIPGHDLRVHELVAVFRLLGVPTQDLPAVLHRAGEGRASLPLGPAGRLELTEPFSVVAGAKDRWRTRARLHGTGLRLVPFTRVVVELSPWSPDASELRVRPVSRSPHAWGTSRLRRYLRLAPLAADALASQLVRAAAAVTHPSSTGRGTGAAASVAVPLPTGAHPLDDRTAASAPAA